MARVRSVSSMLAAIASGGWLWVACVGDDPVSVVPDASPADSQPPNTPPPEADASESGVPPRPPADAAEAGTPFHYVFVTSARLAGNFAAGLPAGKTPWTFIDDLCQAEAIAASLPGRYVGWLSYTASTGTKFNASGRIADWPYYLPGSATGIKPVLVTTSRANLLGEIGPLVPMNRLASGLPVDQDESPTVTHVWTATNSDGSAAFIDCNAWTSDDSAVKAIAGNARNVGAPGEWTGSSIRSCDVRRRFYCFEVP